MSKLKKVRIIEGGYAIDRDVCKILPITNNVLFNWLQLVNLTFKEQMSYKEVTVLTVILKYYINISKEVTDEEKINALLFSQEYRKKIKTEIGIKDNYFDVILNKLRTHGAIKDNNINRVIVPPTQTDEFILLIPFKQEDEKRKGAA